MIVSPALAAQPCGIIFEGEKNELAGVIADKLHCLGLFRDRKCEVFTPELNSALNEYRRKNFLPEFDYCDPVTLRMLTGIETEGENLLLLARLCEAELPRATEVERYDFCRTAISESRKYALTLQQYINGRRSAGELLNSKAPSTETVKTAVLAYLMESGR